MSLNLYIQFNVCPRCKIGPTLFETAVSHNVIPMAKAAGVYEILWKRAKKQRVPTTIVFEKVVEGIARMARTPQTFIDLEAENGWGTYDDFKGWLEKLAIAIMNNGDATYIRTTL